MSGRRAAFVTATALRRPRPSGGAPVPGGVLLAMLLPVLWPVLFLSGCANVPGGGPALEGRSEEVRTASDQTDADRRAKLRLELASGYFGLGQLDAALDDVKLALQARPDLPEAWNLRGLIYAAMNENRLADDSFQRALSLNARDGDIKHNYGWFLCQQQRYADAQAQFEAALASPQYRDPVRTLLAQGVCQARAGRLDLAERSLTRAYEFDAGNPTIAVNLAEVLYLRGEYERARFHVRRMNVRPETSNEQSLWLAVRIEHKLGNQAGVDEWGRQLRARFPQSQQLQLLERGQFE